MTTCPQCGTQNLPGMAYCEHCGAQLEQEQAPQDAGADPVAAAASAQAQAILDSLNTTESPADTSAANPVSAQPTNTPVVSADPDSAAPPDATEATPADPVMTLTFSNGATFEVTAEVTNVGRSDVAQGWHPELDVIPFGGGAPDLGVSRHQARIQRDGRAFSIVDVGSTNGTFVNGKVLTYNAPVALQDGDALAFGAFNVTVSVK